MVTVARDEKEGHQNTGSDDLVEHQRHWAMREHGVAAAVVVVDGCRADE